MDKVEVVDGEGGDGQIVIVPKFSGVGLLAEFITISGNNFDAGCLGEFDDVFWCPVRVLIESVNDGFPGVDIHNPVEHFGVVNLNDEAVEDCRIVFFSISDNLIEFGINVSLVSIFRIGDEINIWIF